MHEGSIQSGSLLTGYALKYIICHIQYGFTHIYCFILTLPILLLLLPGFFNYFKGILENLLTYDNFLPFIYFCWYAEKHYTKFKRNWFPLRLLVIFCRATKHCISLNLPFHCILTYCQSFLSATLSFSCKIYTLFYHDFTGFDCWSKLRSVTKNILQHALILPDLPQTDLLFTSELLFLPVPFLITEQLPFYYIPNRAYYPVGFFSIVCLPSLGSINSNRFSFIQIHIMILSLVGQ